MRQENHQHQRVGDADCAEGEKSRSPAEQLRNAAAEAAEDRSGVDAAEMQSRRAAAGGAAVILDDQRHGSRHVKGFADAERGASDEYFSERVRNARVERRG